MNNAQLPWGTTAWLPEECRRLRQSESLLRDLFTAAGAEEIATPTFEQALVFEKGLGAFAKLFRFLDADGAQLALRPELTTPAARLFATALADRALPLRVFYIGQVFRQETMHRGRFREFRQVGFEFFGGPAASADAEVARLCSSALTALGFSDAVIDIGNVAVVNTLLDEADLSGAARSEILRAIERRDESALAGLQAPAVLLELLRLGHEPSDLDRARGLSGSARYSSALDELRGLAMAITGIPQKVVIDLAAVPKLDYYTGMVVQAYVRGQGRPAASGGRYDGLVEVFGRSTPATGFSLELERLIRS